MRKDRFLTGLSLILFSLFLITSCSSKGTNVAEDTTANIPVEQVGVNGTGEGQGYGATDQIQEGVVGSEGIREPGGEGAIMEGRTTAPLRPIYFDFDRYDIRPDMIERMESNAQFLKEHPEYKVEIQGNCDERGTNEYNLALGEKRARAAKNFLVNMGIDPNRIFVVSLGEEKPLDPGHNEQAWAKNRRDDFILYR